jgi:RNA polymerase sigma-70 factor (ECF subfamily)
MSCTSTCYTVCSSDLNVGNGGQLAVLQALPYTFACEEVSAMTETSILERIAAGDGDAVQECMDRYGGLVWSLARRMAPAMAEDAVQEIFIDLWKSAARFDSNKASEKTFIATVARRRLIDRLRRQGRRPQMRSLPEPDEPTAEPSVDDHLVIQRGAEARSAARYLDALRPEQRQVIRLSVVEGMSHSEIADATGIAIGTVKSHIFRGLAKVRARLADAQAAAEGSPS